MKTIINTRKKLGNFTVFPLYFTIYNHISTMFFNQNILLYG